MDDAAFMCRVEAVHDLAGDRDRLITREWMSCSLPFDTLGERLSLDQLENERVNARMLLQPINRGDVGMIERGERARLALEPSQPIRIGSKDDRQNLQRHIATKLGVVRAIHLAHAADAKDARDAIRAELRASQQRHVRLGEVNYRWCGKLDSRRR